VKVRQLIRNARALPFSVRRPLWLDMGGSDHLLACRQHRSLLVKPSRVHYPDGVRSYFNERGLNVCEVGGHS
jgi:hypothetical protein